MQTGTPQSSAAINSGDGSRYSYSGSTKQPNNPITAQPRSSNVHSNVQGRENFEGNWMAPPRDVPAGCPRGLEYLMTLDQLFVRQKVQFLEGANKYKIMNKNGDYIYYAAEDFDFLNGCCCGGGRSFTLKIFDNTQTEIIRVRRDYSCCLQDVNVYAPPNQFVGSITEQMSCCQPEFNINDHSGRTVLKIEGPMCTAGVEADYEILALNGVAVGRISKQWSGFFRELFTRADNFGISFPVDLDVRMKAVMIGACFLIDFMYYEHH